MVLVYTRTIWGRNYFFVFHHKSAVKKLKIIYMKR